MMGKKKPPELLGVGGRGVMIIVALIIFFVGIYVGENDDASGATLLGLLIMIVIIFYFGYKKGEKPRWQWGLPKKDE